MTQRAYTLSEIDRMRQSLRWSYPSGVSYRPEQKSAEIEDRLRTYMQNGTDPKELEKLASERIELERKHGPGVVVITIPGTSHNTAPGAMGRNGGCGALTRLSGLVVQDMSAETLGKYQYCSLANDGLWYADQDMRGGSPIRGAIPSPRQHDPMKQARADRIIKAQAEEITKAALTPNRAHSRGLMADWLRRVWNRMRD